MGDKLFLQRFDAQVGQPEGHAWALKTTDLPWGPGLTWSNWLLQKSIPVKPKLKVGIRALVVWVINTPLQQQSCRFTQSALAAVYKLQCKLPNTYPFLL